MKTFYAVRDVENDHNICYYLSDLKTAKSELSKWQKTLKNCQHSVLKIIKITEEEIEP